MLTKIKARRVRLTDARIAIIASAYNGEYVDSMARAARRTLRAAGVTKIRLIRVPGAYEIPVVAATLASRSQEKYDSLICLGVILRGQTTHAQFIGEAVTGALTQIQLQYGVPVVHEVLLLENREQARARCLDPKHNRGAEAAQTALEMARLMKTLV